MSQSERKANTVYGGAAILVAAAGIVKIIGGIFKIPLSNILGDLGFGHFNNAYVIFNLMLTISTAGLPVALSKSIAEADALGRRSQVVKTFRVAFLTFLALGILSFLFMFLGAAGLADWLGNSGATLAIRALSPCVFFVCVMVSFRGYAQGHMNMVPTSVSQVIEAILKLFVGLALAWYFMSLSIPDRSEIAAAGGISGVTVGAAAGLIYLIVDYLHHRTPPPRQDAQETDAAGKILARLAKIAVPITLGASVMSVVTMIDTVLIQHRLQDALGMTQDAAVGLYGAFQRSMALYQLPPYFIVPFSAVVIPSVAASLTRKDYHQAARISESMLRTTSLIAFPAGIGLSVLAVPIIELLYVGTNVPVAGWTLTVLGIASIFVCIMQISISILQAHGYVNLPIITAAIGGFVKLVVNYILVGNPSIGIYGAPIGTLACFAVVAVLDLVIILRVVPNPPRFARAFFKPLLASAVMGAAAWAVNGLLVRFLPAKLAVIAAIAVAGGIYLILVIVLRVMSTEDVALMPKGDKIAKFLRIK